MKPDSENQIKGSATRPTVIKGFLNNTTGSNNTANGLNALSSNTGSNNTAAGVGAGSSPSE
jgi:hypothetical protein